MVMTGCSWFSGRLVRPLGGSRRGPLGVAHDPCRWRLHADQGANVAVTTARGGFSVPLAVLDHVNGVTVSRLWVPVLQVPTLAGARVTVPFAVTIPLPAVWQAPGVPA